MNVRMYRREEDGGACVVKHREEVRLNVRQIEGQITEGMENQIK